ncbi:hypothetical protein [Nitrosomonas marina]|uniref:Uncharacterized protein n=1 Tax=Nitrosomonas marina TaxID=917 RepID=A0A1H8IMA3_9PROT|nr:hypothetical protein [Nitrosomonas marina]SEN69146.1 hypothetical protein SAMN05216325_1354 [Nitrosomonas marina]
MESAMLLIAAISGIMQGVQVWMVSKDRRKARRAQQAAYVRTLQSDMINVRAEKLLSLVPESTTERLRKKVQECYEKFNEMLDNEDEYFPVDIDNAAEHALPNCVCRNLRRIVNVTGGSLPDDELQEAWTKYQCKS